MRVKLVGVLMTGAMWISVGGAVCAAEQGDLSPAVVAQLNLANKLIALGDARKDPLLLIAAAKIQKNLGGDAPELPSRLSSSSDILARAKTFAAGNNDLTGIIDDIEATRSKGYREDCNGLHHQTVCIDKIIY
jgi:hypothetical protein